MFYRVIFLTLAVVFCNVYCQNGDSNSCSSPWQVRLVNGSNEREGRVEVCIGGRWGTICDDLWDHRDAEVVCKQLNFDINGAVAIAGAHFGEGTGLVVLDNLECNGDEANLGLCPHAGLGNHNCGHVEDASVICQPANFTCYDGEVRLVGGKLPTEGRVEVCFGNQFGTICDDGWDTREARVICRQLGFSISDAIPVTRTAPFGMGIGYINLDNIQCHGNERNISLCNHLGLRIHNCGHSEDAGVMCKPLGQPTVCKNGQVRLAGGRRASEGRVEICFNENWGTICDDGFGEEEARVTCRQLGFPTYGATPLGSDAFGEGSGPIFLDGLNCRGGETTLRECHSNRLGEHNCNHDEDTAVVCQDTNFQCENWTVRLVNGSEEREHEGRVEVCHNNHWGTVCDDSWDSKDATVICNQLGFPGRALALPTAFFGKGQGIVWLSKVQCNGSEGSLLQCPSEINRDPTCLHSRDANVLCTAPSNSSTGMCENGDVRLRNGSITNEGRVELCYHGHWGTICANSWTDQDAGVVCKQMGYNSTGSIATINAFFGEGTGPIFLDGVECSGNESSLFDCPSQRELGLHTCRHSQDVGVICPVDETERTCDNGMILLVGGSSGAEGRVEICINSRWGTVCSGSTASTWNGNDADVVCRQLGFDPTTTRGIPTQGSFGKGSGPILLNDIRCFGNEMSIQDCASSGIGFVTTCDHSKDVGVVCTGMPCRENTVRLRGSPGGSGSMGRVEVCVGGRYHRVSATGFSRNVSMAVCKQINLETESFRLTSGAFFGMGEGDMYSLTLSTSGVVNGTIRLQESSQNNHVGIICQGVVDKCTSGDVRLVGGTNDAEGRVEICLNNEWGTVCDDSWDSNSASVMCKQLGLPYQDAKIAFFGGGKNLSILLNDLKCSGSEESLLQCRRTNLGRSNCVHSEDVGVKCSDSLSPVGTTPNTVLATSIAVPIGIVAALILLLVVVLVGFIAYTRTRIKLLSEDSNEGSETTLELKLPEHSTPIEDRE